jgi:hypothetical protein
MMKVSPFDPEVVPAEEVDPRSVMSAAPPADDEEAAPEEMSDEPGYGHGV